MAGTDAGSARQTLIEVRDTEGRRVAGAAVTISAPGHALPELAYVTDAEGRLSLLLPTGRLTITAHRDGRSGRLDTRSGPDQAGPLAVVLAPAD